MNMNIIRARHILNYLFIFPVLAIGRIIAVDPILRSFNIKRKEFIKIIRLGWSVFIFLFSLMLYIKFDNFYVGFQWLNRIEILKGSNINLLYGIDGISIWFVILTAFLTPICIMCRWNSIKYQFKNFVIYLYITEFLLFQVFRILDLFLFYVFFESILIPMFLIIGVWGSRERKIHAAYQFFLYTFLRSLFMFIAILYIYKQIGSTNYFSILEAKFLPHIELVLWLALFASFAVKVPLMPVHIWLPEAHVEAPTAGSVLLAGILLKMGRYGIIRFRITFFPYATHFFTPMVITICIIGMIYASLTTLRQIDLKKIIAYSSVSHMALATAGLFTENFIGLSGSVILMLSHGIVSRALFLCIGRLYDRYGTRIIRYYGGLVNFMPLFAAIFMLFRLANMGFPGTTAFIGEIVTLTGVFMYNTTSSILLSTGIIFGAAYSIWLYNRVIFGNILKVEYTKHSATYYLEKFRDVNNLEIAYFRILRICLIYYGLFPSNIIESLCFPTTNHALLSVNSHIIIIRD